MRKTIRCDYDKTCEGRTPEKCEECFSYIINGERPNHETNHRKDIYVYHITTEKLFTEIQKDNRLKPSKITGHAIHSVSYEDSIYFTVSVKHCGSWTVSVNSVLIRVLKTELNGVVIKDDISFGFRLIADSQPITDYSLDNGKTWVKVRC